jgi:hypothetical protein
MNYITNTIIRYLLLIYFDKQSEVFRIIIFTKTYKIIIFMIKKPKTKKFSVLFLKKRLDSP